MTDTAETDRRQEQAAAIQEWLDAYESRCNEYRASRLGKERVMAPVPVDDLAVLVGLARMSRAHAYDLGIPWRVLDAVLLRTSGQLEDRATGWLRDAVARYESHLDHWRGER